LRYLIAWAHGLEPYQRVIGDARVLDQRFSILAKADAAVVDAETGDDTHRKLVRQLLVDRFHLKVREESQRQNIYVIRRIRADALGPGLKISFQDCSATIPAPDLSSPATRGPRRPTCRITGIVNGHLTAIAEMSALARFLSSVSQRAVIDETGLRGNFEIDTTFDPSSLGSGPGLIDESSRLPSFTEALKNDLGLRMDTESRFVTALIVEHITAPSDN
jgi:uncharacterized protein (TIGR03435 family)